MYPAQFCPSSSASLSTALFRLLFKLAFVGVQQVVDSGYGGRHGSRESGDASILTISLDVKVGTRHIKHQRLLGMQICSAAVPAVNWVKLRDDKVELRMESNLALRPVGAKMLRLLTYTYTRLRLGQVEYIRLR